MKTRISLLFAVILVGFFTLTTQVFAENDGIPFEIIPKFTEDQEEGVQSYFSIEADGTSKSEAIEFSVKNTDTETREIIVEVVNAFTSPSGAVQYTKEGPEQSEIIDDKYKMTNHLKLEGNNTITLDAGEETTVRAMLDVEDVEGTLLGGLSFQLDGDEGQIPQEGQSTFTIKSKVNMVIGVMVNFDSDELVDLTFEDPFIDPMPSYYAIRLPITLDSPILKKLNMVYDVSYEGESIFNGNTSFDFAPKTKANVSVPWEHETIKSNEEYVFAATVEYVDVDGETKQEEINFTFNYSPETDVVKEITNALTIPFVEGSFPWLLVIVGVVIIGGIVFLVFRKKKGLYALTREDLLEGIENPTETDEAFPKVIRDDNDLYNKVKKVNKDRTGNQIGIYESKKRNGEVYYRLDHVQIYDGDRTYKIK